MMRPIQTGLDVMLQLTLLLLLGLGMSLAIYWAVIQIRRTHRHRITTGDQGMIGMIGRTQTELVPCGEPGRVFVHGEIWRAHSNLRIPAGVDVRVTQVDGLTIEVEPLHPDRLLRGISPRSIVDRHLPNEGEGHG
ncbi:MAG: hypothetical protein RIR86_2854 [Acidobacteriota bacterium]|jgi:membrane-bound serine protease (ClpP class)